MSNLEGICPKCGLHYQDRVLTNGQERKCYKCGTRLKIYHDGALINKKDRIWFVTREYCVDSNQSGELSTDCPDTHKTDIARIFVNLN